MTRKYLDPTPSYVSEQFLICRPVWRVETGRGVRDPVTTRRVTWT